MELYSNVSAYSTCNSKIGHCQCYCVSSTPEGVAPLLTITSPSMVKSFDGKWTEALVPSRADL